MGRFKSIFDDGFQKHLTEGAAFVGKPGIPMLMNLNNTQIPLDMIPFEKARVCRNKRQYIHFYMHDKAFSRVLTATEKYLDLLKSYDGVITPDCTMLIGQSRCLQEANTYMNRAVGFYLQKQGIPVIPNVRWSDESSFDYCFLGIPSNTMVSVSTYGCIRTERQKSMFKTGMRAMLDTLHPPITLVHGYMPNEVFDGFRTETEFHRYQSLFERTHQKGDRRHGYRL